MDRHHLANSIRKGATRRPQALLGNFFVFESGDIDQPTLVRSCVLGAAFEGLGGFVPTDSLSNTQELKIETTLLTAFPFLSVRKEWECPHMEAYCEGLAPNSALAGYRLLSPTQIISLRALLEHLNDYHRWTRERIADWLDAETYADSM